MRSASPNPSFSGASSPSASHSQSDNQKPDSPPASAHDPSKASTSDAAQTNNTNATPSTSNARKPNENLQSIINAKNFNEKMDKIDIETFLKDWRHFECKTWHLEPTVRLLSWAGKSIEPYGIDYILNKLGFSHARTTIPKWLQRGIMDPLDNLEALLIIQLLFMVRDDRHANENNK